MLRAANTSKYVVGSYNLDSLDVLGDLARRAASARLPLIFQFGPWSTGRLSIEQIGRSARALLHDAPGVFLHLDHSHDLEFIRAALDAGFDSVMFDGSGIPLDENIDRTQQVVKLCRAHDAAAEGAVGQLEHGVDTSVEDARRFVSKTGVDALSVAIGTAHGKPRTPGQIDLIRLDALSTLGVPLVIHGGSGLPPEVTQAVRCTAVAKVNVATACYRRYRQRHAEAIEQGARFDYPSALAHLAADAFWGIIVERSRLYGCLREDSLG